MASIQPTSSTGNTPLFRTKGRSFLLICVLVFNVLLVVFAPMTRPDPATAQDSDSVAAERDNQSKDPALSHVAETNTPVASTAGATDGVSAAKADRPQSEKTPSDSPPPTSVASATTGEDTQPNGQPNGAQNNPAEAPSRGTETGPSSVAKHNSATTEIHPGSVNPTSSVAANSNHETVAQPKASPLEPSDKENALDANPAFNPSDAAESPDVVIVNPAESGGPVLYLLDGEVHRLEPGESQELTRGRDYTVEFHRGGEFGDAKRVLQAGTYRFGVNDDGWSLTAANTNDTEL